MTTRKLLAATFVGNSFFLLAVPANATGNDQQPEMAVAISRTYIALASPFEARHDSNTVSSPDSATTFFKNAMAKAPQVRMNPAVVKFVQDYLKKNSEALQKVEYRSESVFPIIEPILSRYNVPVALKYLAVVESDLIRTAVSRVGAAGPWQLMPVTARELGLKVSKKTDERKHYTKSTTAAAKYLRDLYAEYGDWLLVIAAYNAGPGTINKAIKRAGSRNFWKLQAFLPAETRGHVKRFISTHYYFEDGGSETTLTKAEYLAHVKALEQFTTAQQEDRNTLEPVMEAALPQHTPEKEIAKEPAAEPLIVKKNK